MPWLNKSELETLWEVAKNLAHRHDLGDFEAADDLGKVEIYLNSLLKRPMLKAYVYQSGITIIADVVEKKLGRTSAVIKRTIKTWCERRGRESARDSLQYPKQAGVIPEKDVKRLWKCLLDTGKPKPREAAIAFGITYVTGARMGEVLQLRIEDHTIKRDDGREFFRFHIRSSKTDAFCRRQEALHLQIDTEHAVPLVAEVKRLLLGKKKGLLLPNLKSCTRTCSDYLGRYSEKLKLETKVKNSREPYKNNRKIKASAHSGRVSFYVHGRRSGISRDVLTHTLRWTPDSAMPAYYERVYNETTEHGAPVQVAETRRRKREETKKPPAKVIGKQ
jgi:integrase